MKKKMITTLLVVVAIAGLLLTAHILVNYFNIVDVIRSIHGG